MKRSQVNIGARFGKLEIVGYAGSDGRGNQMVRVRCSCPERTEKAVRLAGLTFEPYQDRNGKWRRPYRSCGCESKRAHAEYWENRANGISRKAQKRIWRAFQDGKTLKELETRFRLPQGVILAICRLYNRQFPAPARPAIPKGSKARSEWAARFEDDLLF